MKTSFAVLALTVIATALGVPTAALANGQDDPVVTVTQNGDGSTHYRIDKPNVKQPLTAYPEVEFHDGDRVTIIAGGCVQTGGSGRTWKRYVSPSGSNSLRNYYGTVEIPGLFSDATPLRSHVPQWEENQAWGFEGTVRDQDNLWPTKILSLGYADDGYGDNGYWGHDDGTEDQCRNIGAAWVEIMVKPRQ